MKTPPTRISIAVADNLKDSTDAIGAYCRKKPKSTPYHLPGWSNALTHSYGIRTFIILAFDKVKNPRLSSDSSETIKEDSDSDVVGLLNLAHFHHPFFTKQLVSMPFSDNAGILADNASAAQALCEAAIKLAERLKVDNVDLRHAPTLGSDDSSVYRVIDEMCTGSAHQMITEKELMILDLPDSSEELMNSFKAKLRSQIRRPIKSGLTAKVGGPELVDDFYLVFCENMRDLGSPVHSKRLFFNVLLNFPDTSNVVVVYEEDRPLAGSVVIGHNKMLYNPWASSLRQFSRLSPNMLLYWTMLEFACENGYQKFNFGRSTPGEGTYRFKQQWGAQPVPLTWHVFGIQNKQPAIKNEKQRFDKAIRYWQKLPVPITRWIGPRIRKHISL